MSYLINKLDKCKLTLNNRSLTEAIKKVVSIPVILTGGITEVNDGENLISKGKADLIGVARAIYKDSSWAEKAIRSLM